MNIISNLFETLKDVCFLFVKFMLLNVSCLILQKFKISILHQISFNKQYTIKTIKEKENYCYYPSDLANYFNLMYNTAVLASEKK